MTRSSRLKSHTRYPVQTTNEIRRFMEAQLEHFKEEGIDPDAISKEELASTSIAFRKKYETEKSKDTDTVKPESSQ